MRAIKIYIKLVISSVVYYSGLFHVLRFLNRNEPVVLCYHRVVEDFKKESEYSLSELLVSKRSFGRQLRFLRKYYNIISMDSLVDSFEGRFELPKYSLLITFDDGYKDNFSCGYPLLKQSNVPAVIFITTNFIDSKEYPSWEKKRPHSDSLMLSWEDVRVMSREGVCFGGHTDTHLVYHQEANVDSYKEIASSKASIEENIKKPVSVFAYPEGFCNMEAIRKVKEAGYKLAFTLAGKTFFNAPKKYHRFMLERIPINEGMYSYKEKGFFLPIFACAIIGIWKEGK